MGKTVHPNISCFVQQGSSYFENQGQREKQTLCEEKTRFKHTQLVLVEENLLFRLITAFVSYFRVDT